MNKLDYFIKEDGMFIELWFDSEQIKPLLPQCVASTVELIRSNLDLSKLVIVDNTTAEYVRSIKINTNNEVFNRLLEVYANGMNSYYYAHLDPELYTKFQLIYELEPSLRDFILPDIPQLGYRLQDDELYFYNIEDLVNRYGKAVVLYLAQILIQNLNNEHRNRTGDRSKYQLSSEIKIAAFNKDTRTHERVPQFTDNRYFLNLLFLSGCHSLTTDIRSILEMILIQQQAIYDIQRV